jgi:outer membrane protein OmpA-like peptidoglycan-associated protein
VNQTRTTIGPRRLRQFAATLAVACGCALPACALTLDMPGPANTTGERREALGSYRMPIGPYADGALPTRLAEGPVGQIAWRIDAPGLSTLQLLAPLRAQIAAAGFDTIFECETLACGGFDFRFAADILPEPEMHVDLGDFRFLSASRTRNGTDEVLSLIVSKSADQGFVQLTVVGGDALPPPEVTTSTKSPELAAPRIPMAEPSDRPGDMSALLDAGRAVPLDDLVFPSGTATLAPGTYTSLAALAEWLRSHPDATVAFVGHTDASGSLAANTALSKKRASAVRDVLIADYGIAPDRLSAEGVGPLSPRADNTSDAGRQKNRRVEVILTSTR